MSKPMNVIAVVEGKTEQLFIESILAPYLALKSIFIRATQISKPGQKGGDVKFERAQRDIGAHLKQRSDTYVTLFVDYYGIHSDWPGVSSLSPQAAPAWIAQTINTATRAAAMELYGDQRADLRFVPFVAVHEFEALLFSDPQKLAAGLGVGAGQVQAILDTFGAPEAINNDPNSAPSKRLDALSKTRKFRKNTTGITIAQDIGIEKMRENCPLFHDWLLELEQIQEGLNGKEA